MGLFSYIGQRSAFFLIGGMIVAAFFPQASSFMRPALPFLVSLVLAFGLAQLNLKQSILELLKPKRLAIVTAVILCSTVLTSFALSSIVRLFGFSEVSILLLIVFTAAPPLSSSISISIILGFNARLTLQVTLLSMLLIPFLGPICFAVAGLQVDIGLMEMSLRIAAMIVGGFVLAILIQVIIGTDRISRNKNTFSGFAVIIMVIFIFPLFDGVATHIMAAPIQSLQLMLFALFLNFGGHLMTRWLARNITSDETASALGYMFGNRNISIYLAILPFNPMISVFVAAAQIPIYMTPALFRNRATLNDQKNQ